MPASARFASLTQSNTETSARGTLKSCASASKNASRRAADQSGLGPGDEPATRLPDPRRRRGRLLQPGLVVFQRLAPMALGEVHQQRLRAVSLERLAEPEHVANRLRHLLGVEPEHPVVHPDLRQRTARRRLRLRCLVLVMGKDQVRSAAMDLEVGAEQLLRHRRALDVPSRATRPPGRLPARVLAGLVGLPEREVERVTLVAGPSTPRPGPSGRRRGARARRNRRRSEPRSTRRRRPRTRCRPRSAARSAR